MSKEDKPKSAPSPKPGMPLDASHLLGMHSLAASGLPYAQLASPFPHPYPFLAQPAAFPGLFGGLGAIPNPLHAAALSHSLAAASLYGIPKYPNELASPPPTSSSSSNSKRGKSSRSTPTPTSSPSLSSSQQRTSSTSASLGLLSPSSHASLPSHFDPAAIAPYLSGWALNGSAYHLPNLSSPLANEAGSKRASQTTSSWSSSRHAKKSSTSASSNSSSKIPPAHQHDSSSLMSPSSSSSSSALHNNPSADHTKYPAADKMPLPENFPFDPRALITPYHLSPELAYLSQSLFMHRPDLDLSSSLLAAATSSTSASTSNLPSASDSAHKTGGHHSGKQRSQSPLVASKKGDRVKGERSKGEKRTRETSESGEESRRRLTNGTSKDNHSRSSSRVSNHSHGEDSDRQKAEAYTSDEASLDPSNPLHFMDDSRRKHIADQIRKRVGLPESSMASLFAEHGLKQSDWLEHYMSQRGHDKEMDELSASTSSSARQWDPEKEVERRLSEGTSLERQIQLQEERIREFQKKYGLSGKDEGHSSASESHYSDRGRQSGVFSENRDESMDADGSTDSDGVESGKRPHDASSEVSPSKKRCYQTNERELVIPLEHGWNRQTIISGMGRRGIVGEVLYFAPCGKKMKTIPDVMRYLERNPNADLGRENFSYNTKVNVGHFFEVRGGQSTPVPLTDTEVLERIEMSRGKRARMQMLARKKREKAAKEQALARQIMENKLKRRMELQEMSRRASELRFEKKLEKQKQKELEKKLKEDKALEKQKEKEQHKLLKQQERFRLQEQLRKEREMRAQQIIEARNRRQQELEEMRLADAVKRNKEREMKRHQLIMLKEQDRERRRQHLLLIKALEQRKKQEEKQTKERQKEEKLNEKMKQREIRMHQRKVELEVAAELKKPVEDMELKNRKKLPEFPRLKSRLAGKPIADCMMVVEFLNNFGGALNLEKSSLPTLESLERGMMSDTEDDVEELMSLVMHLLRFALDDVGVPNPKEAVTKLNQKITEMEMTDSTMSEILRIFIKARGEKEMSEWLTELPMEALNPTRKAAILGFLCNELLTSKVITGEIDKHMESINNLRRDKWIVEGQLRQLRVFQAKKFNKIHKSTDRRNNAVNNTFSVTSQDEDTVSSSKMGSDEDDDEDGSGNESDGASSVITNVSATSSLNFEPIDDSLTREESDKRLDGLRKQHAAYRQKVFRSCLRLRAINIGQDRYKRTFWILPLTGGIYVEGMESGEPEDYIEEGKVKVKEEPKEEKNANEGSGNESEIIEKLDDAMVKGEGGENDIVEVEVENGEKSVVVNGDAKKDEQEIEDEKVDENVDESINDFENEGDEDEPEDNDDMEVSTITGNHVDMADKEDLDTTGEDQVMNGEDLKANGVNGEDGSDGLKDNDKKEDANDDLMSSPVKMNEKVQLCDKEGFRSGETLFDIIKEGVESQAIDSSVKDSLPVNGHVEDPAMKQNKVVADLRPQENHIVASPNGPQTMNGFSDKLECQNKVSSPQVNNTDVSENDETRNTETIEMESPKEKKGCGEEKFSIDLSKLPYKEKSDASMEREDPCTKPSDDFYNVVSIDLSQRTVPVLKNGVESIDLVTDKDITQNLVTSVDNSKNKSSEVSVQENPMTKTAVTDSQETRGSVSDILKVPKVGHNPQRESLFAVMNHSITKTITEEEESSTTASSEISENTKPAATSLSPSSSSLLPSANSSSILSSSLLFAPYSAKPWPRTSEEATKPNAPASVAVSSMPSSLLVPSPFSTGKQPGIPTAAHAHTGIKRAGQEEGGALNLIGASPVPLPAHSKPLDRNALPPHHPAAQFKAHHRDQTPPAAHSKRTSKPNIPASLEPNVGPSRNPSHAAQSPFIPGISHHPYGGQASASQTLSSLASIVSPPPAHQHPPSTTASSFLMSTPKLPTFTTSTTAPSSSSFSLSSPTASLSSAKTPPSFSLMDIALKNEQHYSSSQLLHHAASQVMRSGECDSANSTSSLSIPISPITSTASANNMSSIDLTIAHGNSSFMNSSTLKSTASPGTSLLPSDSSLASLSSSLNLTELSDETSKGGATSSHEMWFSLLPRTPCDELSLTRPAAQGSTQASSSQLPLSSGAYSSNSSSPISSILNSSLSLESLMPLLQSNPSLLSQESLRTSLQLLASPSPSPTPSSSAGDMSFDFKVPQPPMDMSLNYDPWDILRAAQGEKQPIPKNKRHGWWRVHDLGMLKSCMTATMNRGIREKNLQRAIHRYLDYAKIHSSFDSSIGEKDPSEASTPECKGKKKKQQEAKKEKEDKKSTGGSPVKKEEEEKMETDSKDGVESNDEASSSGDAVKIKKEVKEETDKDPQASDTEESKETAVAAGEDDGAGNAEEEQQEEEEDFVTPDVDDTWSTSALHEVDLATLEEVEALEDRIFNASLQAKYGWKSCQESNYTLVDHSIPEPKDGECHPMVAAKARLMQLESNIERRYLKPPLARSNPLNISSTSDKQQEEDSDEIEDVPPGLALWRQAVDEAQNPAQISLCIQMLVKSISWEKSIMKVICQNCHKDDNEAELLLCDGCDKGFHTYCFKPKMDTIPDGDWYCFECVSKASGTPHCGLCGSKGGKIASCSKCPRCVHLDCMEPPLPRMPKRWQCYNCSSEKGSKRSRKRKESLPTVQRITITKLVIKEEPQDSPDGQSMSAMAPPLKVTPSSSTPPKVESSPKKSDTSTSQATGNCSSGSPNEKKKRKRKEKEPDTATSPATATAAPPPPKKKEKRERKDRKPKVEPPKEPQVDDEADSEEKIAEKERLKDLTSCGKLLAEMEKHSDGWPFLKPVSQKQFPSYKKYIKTPMDFNTMKSKLKNKGYKHRQEFALDIRLIFDNCETFNEDDSEVGQAGHTMRSFFEQRWISLFPNDTAQS